MGDRFGHLQNAIDKLFEEVGAVVKISSVYETPAMGFEGDPFYNCVVWIKSQLSPTQILKSALDIEKKMGRQRKDSKKYTSRPIDIDILFIEDQTINSEKLVIPHPGIPDRRFVLKPLCDVNPKLLHPVLNKTIAQLLEETPDTSPITKLAKWLVNPMSEYNVSKFNYITIEGNIGAGKTSLSTKISEDFNAKLILERFKDNPFLPKFYQDSARYAFPLEMSFLADRYQQLVDDTSQIDLFTDLVVSDYDVNKSLIFASITLQEEEYALYKKLFQMMHKDLPKPDLYIYLYQNTERLLENIKKRGRKYEQGIQPEYLQKLNAGYLEFIKNQHSDYIKIIDISGLDFIKNRSDYLLLLRQIIG